MSDQVGASPAGGQAASGEPASSLRQGASPCSCINEAGIVHAHAGRAALAARRDVFTLWFTPLRACAVLTPTREAKNPAVAGLFVRVSEGTRTPDRLDHNQELYQLSYAHHGEEREFSVRRAGQTLRRRTRRSQRRGSAQLSGVRSSAATSASPTCRSARWESASPGCVRRGRAEQRDQADRAAATATAASASARHSLGGAARGSARPPGAMPARAAPAVRRAAPEARGQASRPRARRRAESRCGGCCGVGRATACCLAAASTRSVTSLLSRWAARQPRPIDSCSSGMLAGLRGSSFWPGAGSTCVRRARPTGRGPMARRSRGAPRR